MRRLAAAAVSVLLAAGLPAAADASTAYINGDGNPEARGEPGETNDMTARAGGDGVIFTDAVGIRPREGDLGCRALSLTEVTCLGEGGALLFGDDGDDTLKDAGLTTGFHAEGGPGNDTITAAAAVAIIYGDANRVDPSDGDDRIVGSSATAAASSGREHDFDDTLNGGGGDDTIDAGPGMDLASGQSGNDTIDGGPGDDALDSTTLLTSDERDAPGDAGDDTLTGGDGNDQVDAIRGRDKADGGAGDDYLRGLDVDLTRDDKRADTLACGGGRDRVAAGRNDRVVVGCERLLVGIYCVPRYPCRVKGTVSSVGRKPKVVASRTATLRGPGTFEIPLGARAARQIGSKRSVPLFTQVVATRGRRPAGSNFLLFRLMRAG